MNAPELRKLSEQFADVVGVANALNHAADQIEIYEQFLDLLDSAGVTMNGMAITEAFRRLREIAAPDSAPPAPIPRGTQPASACSERLANNDSAVGRSAKP